MFEEKPGATRLDITDRIRRLKSKLKAKRQSPLSLANELRTIKIRSGLPWSQIDRRLGLSATHRKLLICLLSLPSDMARALNFGQSTRRRLEQTGLSLKHARSLYLLRDRPDQQRALYNQLTLQRASANQALRSVLARRKGNAVELADENPDPNLEAALDRLRYKLGTRVQVRRRRQGGEFVIEFYGEEDLIRLYDLLMR